MLRIRLGYARLDVRYIAFFDVTEIRSVSRVLCRQLVAFSR